MLSSCISTAVLAAAVTQVVRALLLGLKNGKGKRREILKCSDWRALTVLLDKAVKHLSNGSHTARAFCAVAAEVSEVLGLRWLHL